MCHSFTGHIWFANLAVNWHIKANCMCQIRQFCKAGSTQFVVRICDASCVMIRASCVWKNVSNLSRWSFVHLSHLVRQLGGKLTHQSKLYVSDSTNLFDTFTHDVPQICTTHRVDPALSTFTHDAPQIRTTHRVDPALDTFTHDAPQIRATHPVEPALHLVINLCERLRH